MQTRATTSMTTTTTPDAFQTPPSSTANSVPPQPPQAPQAPQAHGQLVPPIAVSIKDAVRRRLFDRAPKHVTTTVTQDCSTQDCSTQYDPADFTGPEDLHQCSICLSDKCDAVGSKHTNTTTTECGHVFCTSCLLKHLTFQNTCPNCRAEIEPARKQVIEQLTANVVANIIEGEEVTVDVTRRIAVIGAFRESEARNAMIMSLVREVAFGVGHGLAAWQGTDETQYHASWNEFEYTQAADDDDDDEDESDDDDESDDGSIGTRSIGSVGSVGSINCHNQNDDQEVIHAANELSAISTVSAMSSRAEVQSPLFRTIRPVYPVEPVPVQQSLQAVQAAAVQTMQEVAVQAMQAVQLQHSEIQRLARLQADIDFNNAHTYTTWGVIIRLTILAYAIYMHM